MCSSLTCAGLAAIRCTRSARFAQRCSIRADRSDIGACSSPIAVPFPKVGWGLREWPKRTRLNPPRQPSRMTRQIQGRSMNNIIYIIGLIVVVLAILIDRYRTRACEQFLDGLGHALNLAVDGATPRPGCPWQRFPRFAA